MGTDQDEAGNQESSLLQVHARDQSQECCSAWKAAGGQHSWAYTVLFLDTLQPRAMSVGNIYTTWTHLHHLDAMEPGSHSLGQAAVTSLFTLPGPARLRDAFLWHMRVACHW